MGLVHSRPSAAPRPSPDGAPDPLNNIPPLSSEPAEGQTVPLSSHRTPSSIPRPALPSSAPPGRSSACPRSVGGASSDGTWVYPSPQQFYNALLRKGSHPPPDAVPVMVDIHNWLNEAVWHEVLQWESRYFAPSPPPGPRPSSGDLAPSAPSPSVTLARFQGRPHDLSPKARYHLLLSRLFPSTYSSQEPFDRHDWHIRRDSWDEPGKEVLHRYVIDYYTADPDEKGRPVFHFDVRPAIDDLCSLSVRLREWARVKGVAWFGNGETPRTSAPNSQSQ